jgi:hypothetical protein
MGVQETDFLGYWLTPTGMKPWTKTMDTILCMDAPKNVKQVCSFHLVVQLRIIMTFGQNAHTSLTLLTELTGKRKFLWEDDQQQAFE